MEGLDEKPDYFMSRNWNEKRVRFTCVSSGAVLDLSGANSQNGTVVQGFKDNGTNAQRWYLHKLDPGSRWSPWVIKNAATGTWLDLSNGGTGDGTMVQGWNMTWDDVRGNKNAQWYIITREENNATVFCLQNARSFTYLTHDDPFSKIFGIRKSDYNAPVTGWHRFDGRNTQQWRVVIA